MTSILTHSACSGVYINGSIAKYFHGENITPLTQNEIREGFNLLQHDTGIDLSKSKIKSVEFGSSFIMNNPVIYYLHNFAERRYFKKGLYCGKYDNLETVEYFTNTGSYKYKAYNKIQEIKDKKEAIPALYQNNYVLRLEYTISKAAAIEKEFGNSLTPFDLSNRLVLEKLNSLFSEFYSKIQKTGNKVYIDITENLTPGVFTNFLAWQYMESDKDLFDLTLQSAKEKGYLSKANYYRIKDLEKNKFKTKIISADELNTELDEKVRQLPLRCA